MNKIVFFGFSRDISRKLLKNSMKECDLRHLIFVQMELTLFNHLQLKVFHKEPY